MSEKLRILITGFRPFPGAPYNPTQPLVERLMRLRRPALADVELSSHIFPVTYSAVDRQLPESLTNYRPQALLMFGLARAPPFPGRDPRPQRRHHAVARRRPRAGRKGSIAGGADALMFGPHTAKLLRGRSSPASMRAPRDAGSYLCNYLSWRAIEATRRDDGPASPPSSMFRCWRARALPREGSAPHHAGRTGRRRRSHADGDGEADARRGRDSRARPEGRLTLPSIIAVCRPRASPCSAVFWRYCH